MPWYILSMNEIHTARAEGKIRLPQIKFPQPEGITIAAFAVSCGLIALSIVQVFVAQPHEQWVRTLPWFLVMALTCTAELFLSRLRHFAIVLVVQTVTLLAVIFASGDGYHLIRIMMMTIFVLSVVLRLPAPYSVPICVTAMIATGVAAHLDGEPLIGSVVVVGIELTILLLTVEVIRYRESVVRTLDELDLERESVDNLAAANDSLLRQLPEMKEESAERERMRITRDLHDTLGYAMTNITMIMNAAQYLMESDIGKVREYCLRTKQLATTTMEETRSTLYKLREIGHRTPDNPAIFFHQLCRDFEEATSTVTECNPGNLVQQLPRRVFDVLLRTVQVAFINALKHGRATRIRLFFWVGADDLTMTIWNSMDPAQLNRSMMSREGIGLSGVRERLEELEGSIRASYVVDGFSLVAHIPRKELANGINSSNRSR